MNLIILSFPTAMVVTLGFTGSFLAIMALSSLSYRLFHRRRPVLLEAVFGNAVVLLIPQFFGSVVPFSIAAMEDNGWEALVVWVPFETSLGDGLT